MNPAAARTPNNLGRACHKDGRVDHFFHYISPAVLLEDRQHQRDLTVVTDANDVTIEREVSRFAATQFRFARWSSVRANVSIRLTAARDSFEKPELR